MSICIGIDPDLHNTAIAVVERLDPKAQPTVLLLNLQKISPKLKENYAALAMCLLWDPAPIAEAIAGRPYGLVVEGQDVRYTARDEGKNPQDIVHLAAVAGGAISTFSCLSEADGKKAWYPYPAKWKKGVPKVIHQERVLARYGWPCERVMAVRKPNRNKMKRSTLVGDGYCVPTNTGILTVWEMTAGITRPMWKHVVDSMGLALYGLDIMQGVIRDVK